ncbi:hypothetical protein JRI60_03670 [Archangium violaceum]|uniref:calcium-binding protein n=1 Tax=Archangium violaceum TaxID=83451 RepID=UPI001950A13F|nr:calcium-binding protein [Archangium violaceum]QRN98182.1 hypothetical protein JRI60_03670 [Archangium violaceum]
MKRRGATPWKVALVFGGLALPAAARAATVQLQPGPRGQQMIDFQANPGEFNQVTIQELTPGRLYQISDAVPLTAVGPGCRSVGRFTAQCASSSNVSLSAINANLRNLDDNLRPLGPLSIPLTVIGKAADDTLIGGDAADNLKGGGGNDTLDGGNGNDSLNGGNGIDTLNGGPGNDNILSQDGNRDQVNCGPGVDSVTADNFDQLVDCEGVQTRQAGPFDGENDE